MTLLRRTLAIAMIACAIGAVVACVRSVPTGSPAKLGTATNSGGAPVLYVLSGSSLDAGASTLIGSSISGLEHSDFLDFDCKIVGATGDAGADVYLQKLVAKNPDVWVDFAHFPKVAATVTAAYDVASDNFDSVPYLVAVSTDDASTPALEAGTLAHGHPGTTLRVVVVTSAGTVTTPASVTCYINGRTRN